MMRIRQPEAFLLLQEHFRPLLFTAGMDSPESIQCMVMDEQTGESLVLTGLPCGISLTHAQLVELMTIIELDIAALRPALVRPASTARVENGG